MKIKIKKLLAVLAGCMAIITALILVDYLEPEPVTFKQGERIIPPVSVIEVVPSAYESSLTLLATTAVKWPIQLKATSSSQLDWLNTELEPGVLIKKGTLLAKLNTSALESNLAHAKSNVKQAELSLKQAQHEQTVALKMLYPETSSSFARREPQVSAAKAYLNHAKQEQRSAIKQLEEASIIAPFDAIIMHRYASPGEWLETGQVVFDLAASDSLNIELPISELNWKQVRPSLNHPEITIQSRDGYEWAARVRYVAPQVDPTTRQRRLVLSVHKPYQSNTRLVPNQQVKVVINLGKQLQVTILPLSSITRDGYVWTLDEQNRLQKEQVRIINQGPNYVYARFKQDSSRSRKVVIYPLLSMIPGKQVSPQTVQSSLANPKQEGSR